MKRKNAKILLCVISALLLVAVSVVGTLAYLTKSTEEVSNTFTVGNLFEDDEPDNDDDITNDNFILLEHKADDSDNDGVYTLSDDELVKANEYSVMPGVAIPKDPFIKTNNDTTVDSYVFVEVVDSTSSSLTFTISDSFTELTGVTGTNGGKVYRLTDNDGILEAGALPETAILDGDTITVANEEITSPGSLNFYGYMIQSAGFDSAEEAAEALGFTTAP